MRKFIITGMAVAMLAVPAAAMADQPDGSSYIVNESSLAAQDIGKGERTR